MSRMGILSNCVLRLAVKQGFRQSSIRCLSSVSNRQRILNNHTNRIHQEKFLYIEPVTKKVIRCRLYSTGNFPDHNTVLLPALSPTMEMGSIVSWAKKEGDKLNEGDLLAEIETDKATMGFETPEEGYLAKILVPAGTRDVPVGKLVCIIVENQGDVAAFKDFKDDGAVVAKPSAGGPAPVPSKPVSAPAPAPAPIATAQRPSTAPPHQSAGRVYASPMAKRLAEQQNISIESISQGSGLFGSVKSSDLQRGQPAATGSVQQFAAGPDTTFTDIALTNMRSVIAKRLVLSKTTIPHYYLTVDLHVDESLKLRKDLNKSLEKSGSKLSINDFIIKATALASKKVPEANSAWMDTFIREYHSVDVSVAVSTDKGLITPIVFNADTKGLVEISNDVKRLAQKAREGKLQPHEFQGGTISVSNLGMFNVTHFAAVINPPQACILAIGGLQNRLIPSKDSDKGVSANFMTVTLSCDHRVVDGAVGARWLTEFRDLMENPSKMLL